MSIASLLWSVLFGAVGLGFFIYGKKQSAIVPLGCGVALMIFPYFVSSTWLLVLIGAALMAAPYFFRL
jgi:hypothetical protein